jgi:hypothetical protein
VLGGRRRSSLASGGARRGVGKEQPEIAAGKASRIGPSAVVAFGSSIRRRAPAAICSRCWPGVLGWAPCCKAVDGGCPSFIALQLRHLCGEQLFQTLSLRHIWLMLDELQETINVQPRDEVLHGIATAAPVRRQRRSERSWPLFDND